MIKSKSTHMLCLVFLTTQAPIFCTAEGQRVSGPHEVDHSAHIEEVGGCTYPWLQVRGTDLTFNSESEIQIIVDDLMGEGFTPIFVCGQIQVAALRDTFPEVPCLNPAMLRDLNDGSGKAAPGLVVAAGSLDDEERLEIGRMLGFEPLAQTEEAAS